MSINTALVDVYSKDRIDRVYSQWRMVLGEAGWKRIVETHFSRALGVGGFWDFIHRHLGR